jgi:hypothetical protein
VTHAFRAQDLNLGKIADAMREIAARLGNDGLESLSQLPDRELTTLCRRQRDGELGEAEIAEIRSRYRNRDV